MARARYIPGALVEARNSKYGYDDAAKLDMAFPLPGIHAIKELNDWLLDTHIDDNKASEATNLIRKWIQDYV